MQTVDHLAQCCFLVIIIGQVCEEEELLQDTLVDFVVTVYPRIVSDGATCGEWRSIVFRPKTPTLGRCCT